MTVTPVRSTRYEQADGPRHDDPQSALPSPEDGPSLHPD